MKDLFIQKRKSLTMPINSILQHKKRKYQITQKRKQLGQHIYSVFSVFSRNSLGGITIVINLGLVMLILTPDIGQGFYN